MVVEQFQTDAVWNLSQEIRSWWHRERSSEHDVIRRSSRSSVMVFVLLLLCFSWTATTPRHQDCGGALRITTVLRFDWA